MTSLLSELFPVVYIACFVILLWQAFRVMGQGFHAVPRPGDKGIGSTDPGPPGSDRTGRLTIHPELLDADGQLTQEDLLTVRFSGDNEQPAFPADPS
jgi:hypothetical protein